MKKILRNIQLKIFLKDLFQSKFVDLNQNINSLIRRNNQIKEINEENKTTLITVENISKLPEDFDAEIYLKLNPDVQEAGEDPAIHFLKYGLEEGRFWQLPEDFDDEVYLKLNPDVKKAGEDPAIHFLKYGLEEGRFWQLPEDFDDEVYLKLNPDLKKVGEDPAIHFLKYGLQEGRLWQKNRLSKRPEFANHENIWPWLEINASKKGLKVLEIGSRAVVSDSLWKKFIPNCEYIGFDVSHGKNVDVVGDIHRLSDYFPDNHFDFIISFAVFEHLAMPWIASEEIYKVLKTGGHVVIETHFSFSEHELPWHYFQFNSNALEVLFCKELGFELIDSGLYNPIVGKFTDDASENLRGKEVKELYCHSSIVAKKYKDISINKNYNFSWRDAYKRISSESSYPLESDLLRKGKIKK